MTPPLPPLIFLAVSGSQAHGTARAGSDIDLRGVCVVPLAARLSLFESFDQYEGPWAPTLFPRAASRIERHREAGPTLEAEAECVVFDVGKFLRLCAAANPSALEILFSAEDDWLIETPQWRRVQAERRRFLSMKVQQTFLGYAMAQLKRIKTHRAWLLDPPRRKPSRQDFGLPEATTLSSDDRHRIEAALEAKSRSYGIDDVDMSRTARLALQERLRSFWSDTLAVPEDDLEASMNAVAGRALNLPSEVMTALGAEKRYRAAMRHWESYQAWKAQRNPVRAELERRHGYDTKHAMHLVRLMRMGLEILQHGELLVRRPDAGELSAIRDGALSFDRLLEHARELQARMEQAARTSRLPPDVDRSAVDALAFELMAG